ncbi:hypothetical protein CYLTODRAFT_445957 [Cylindrobasidium torrendii FP15055 ss-10]|uniref:Uncharacterized protein n=1 Tax=Cylindrobasidium torrendii FP15055 ss-10 TaxID=1314674 RepID=A0A0D7B2T4_9AGAR|nr:hypothetical protein CYLTODRAFT_445957 [Cylindrobasidium torrendii FP15055 ss-10]
MVTQNQVHCSPPCTKSIGMMGTFRVENFKPQDQMELNFVENVMTGYQGLSTRRDPEQTPNRHSPNMSKNKEKKAQINAKTVDNTDLPESATVVAYAAAIISGVDQSPRDAIFDNFDAAPKRVLGKRSRQDSTKSIATPREPSVKDPTLELLSDIPIEVYAKETSATIPGKTNIPAFVVQIQGNEKCYFSALIAPAHKTLSVVTKMNRNTLPKSSYFIFNRQEKKPLILRLCCVSEHAPSDADSFVRADYEQASIESEARVIASIKAQAPRYSARLLETKRRRIGRNSASHVSVPQGSSSEEVMLGELDMLASSAWTSGSSTDIFGGQVNLNGIEEMDLFDEKPMVVDDSLLDGALWQI